MKKVILTVATLLSIVSVTNAQKGSILLGGDISTQRTNTPTNNTSVNSIDGDFRLSPTIGYQFDNHFTAGITGDYLTVKNPTLTGATSTGTRTFDAGPFVRYAQSLSNIFAVYGQLQGVFGNLNATSGGSAVGSATGVTNVKLFPAAFINLKNSFGLNFTLGGLEFNSTKPNGSNATNNTKLTFGSSLGIGLSKNFLTSSSRGHKDHHNRDN